MGRKTSTYDVDTRAETAYRFEQQQKNLGTQLGGVIFSAWDAVRRAVLPLVLLLPLAVGLAFACCHLSASPPPPQCAPTARTTRAWT